MEMELEDCSFERECEVDEEEVHHALSFGDGSSPLYGRGFGQGDEEDEGEREARMAWRVAQREFLKLEFEESSFVGDGLDGAGAGGERTSFEREDSDTLAHNDPLRASFNVGAGSRDAGLMPHFRSANSNSESNSDREKSHMNGTDKRSRNGNRNSSVWDDGEKFWDFLHPESPHLSRQPRTATSETPSTSTPTSSAPPPPTAALATTPAVSSWGLDFSPPTPAPTDLDLSLGAGDFYKPGKENGSDGKQDSFRTTSRSHQRSPQRRSDMRKSAILNVSLSAANKFPQVPLSGRSPERSQGAGREKERGWGFDVGGVDSGLDGKDGGRGWNDGKGEGLEGGGNGNAMTPRMRIQICPPSSEGGGGGADGNGSGGDGSKRRKDVYDRDGFLL
ncbi:hypothetical protein K402DRAFT_398562 [Aulographum hederae CBS 113979]|uniref:Uncharacterized protein n=1 Tax=Aulographum hederae CBS 113979 TaxID=1176131 RepID=A0A6G1GKJ9_9PEZI|nr:hypothetical protein K402DRAFT_398562 [Aulographum hederae CBS 113979]